ncbi:MAG: sugar-binding protein [Eubacteriales bacterium]
MKKFLSAALSLMLVVSGFAVSSFATRDLTYTAPKGTPTIDGTAEALWDTAEWTNVDLPYSADEDTYGGHALRVKLLWDDTALYVLGEMTCANTADDLDYIEVYIDEAGDKIEYGADDMQVGFSKDGVLDNYGTNNRSGDCEAVSVVSDTGFVCEAKILWSGEVAIAQGNTLGLEFMANIQPDGAFAQAYRWNVDTAAGDEAPWAGTAMWGNLVLGAEPAVEEAPAAEEAPATEAPATEEAPVENTTAAQTGDATAAFAALAVVALGAAVVVTKKVRG